MFAAHCGFPARPGLAGLSATPRPRATPRAGATLRPGATPEPPLPFAKPGLATRRASGTTCGAGSCSVDRLWPSVPRSDGPGHPAAGCCSPRLGEAAHPTPKPPPPQQPGGSKPPPAAQAPRELREAAAAAELSGRRRPPVLPRSEGSDSGPKGKAEPCILRHGSGTRVIQPREVTARHGHWILRGRVVLRQLRKPGVVEPRALTRSLIPWGP